jgi:trigger factor
VIRVFGREAVQQQALEDFGQELYEKALEEVDYNAYEVGELEDVEWDPFRMTVLLPIEPEVDLGDYRDVRVPFEPEEVNEEDVKEYLVGLQKEHAQWVPVERPAILGDRVVLDIEGSAGDAQFMSNEDYEMQLEAEGSYPLPGFHEQIVGMSPGEEKTFEVTVPEDDFDESVAGQQGTVAVRLHTVKEEDLPPLDDDLALMVGDYDSLAELEAATLERLQTEAFQKAETEYLDKVLEAMIEAAVKIEYPPQAVDREAEIALNQMERNLAGSGIELDTYLGMIGKSREMYRQEFHPAARDRLKRRLVLNQVAEREGLKVEVEEIDAEIDRLSEMMGEQAGEMREMLESPTGRLSVADDLMVARVQARIVEIGKGEATPLEQAADKDTDVDAEVTEGAEGDVADAPDGVEGSEAAAEAVEEDAGKAGEQAAVEESGDEPQD